MREFESLGLKAGIWQGMLMRGTPPGRLILVHLGAPVANARVTPEGEGRWRVAAAIPAERLSDGVQTFLLYEDMAENDAPPAPAPGAIPLGRLTMVAGALLDDDLRAELDLLRSELDLVKKELRRLARD
ncbi:hypothetical protein [Paracoccus lutimaris]|uniref:Uncharacterized protein n=1 Tax=Paracoccus lutimaris TaxID=1490030 RepID=A0A368YV31_9RHOB|nr:hypothetical protein [Paracoccus lutimaris]RCW84082.1 hypothetical protein DFP89_10825 [Paracoccus lutimaris]